MADVDAIHTDHSASLLPLGGLEGFALQRGIILLLLFASCAGKKQQQKKCSRGSAAPATPGELASSITVIAGRVGRNTYSCFCWRKEEFRGRRSRLHRHRLCNSPVLSAIRTSILHLNDTIIYSTI